MKDRDRLIRDGSHERTSAVVDEADVYDGLLDSYRSPLFQWGLNEPFLAQYRSDLASCKAMIASKDTAAEASVMATRQQEELVGRVKGLVRHFRLAVPIVLSAHPELQVREEAFESGKLGRNVSKLLNYLDAIREHVEKVDGPLKPFFKGESPLEKLDGLREELKRVQVEQEIALKKAPQGTEALNELKGRLLDSMDTIRRVARIAFDGQATTLAQFNKDILLRGRRARRGSKPSEAPTTDSQPE